VEKFGYDTKNAAHMIRLLHMGAEYLETGEMKVRRTWDRELILRIKRGEWTLNQVNGYAEHCFGLCRSALAKSPLPEAIDSEAVDSLLVQQISRFA